MKVFFLLVSLLACAGASAQLRLDASARFGRSSVKFFYSGGFAHGLHSWDGRLSVGGDVRIGYELPLGFGVYSGGSYDFFRTFGSEPPIIGLADADRRSALFKFHFLTVPLLAEYRFLRNIVRPYGGIGAAFLLGGRDNYLERMYSNYAKFHYRTATPSLLFGVNLEYRRMILGLAVRRDLAPFWEDAHYFHCSWKARLVSARLGFRIF